MPYSASASAADRQQHASQHRRHAQRCDAAQAERVQRKEGRARGRVDAEVGAVAVAGDHQVPGRVPARRRSGEQVAEPAEATGHARGVEGFALGPEAEGEHRAHARDPDEQARAPQRPPAVAHGGHPRGVRAQPREPGGVRAQPREPPCGRSQRPRGRWLPRGARALERLRQLARALGHGELGGVGVHGLASSVEIAALASGRKSQQRTVISNRRRCPVQARKRRHSRSGGARILLVGASTVAVSLVIGVLAAVGLRPERRARHARALSIAARAHRRRLLRGLRRRRRRASASSSPTNCARPSAGAKSRPISRTRPSRSRTSASTKTTASTSPASSAPRSRTSVHGQALQGASTITMQLVRNLYLGGDEHTLKQKITEAKLALEYNKHHSKRSILNSYLNSVPYGTVGGQTTIGVQAAARIFFDKPVSQLDLEQSALLAGLPQAPSQYNPLLNPAAATERRNEVLAKMAELHYISQAHGPRRPSGRRWRHAAATTTPNAKKLLLRIRPPAAGRTLRREDRRAGRAEGLHDDRPEHAAARAQSDRGSAQRARRPGLGDRHDRTPPTATSRRWRSPRATSSRSTTSPPTATASRARRSRRSTSPTRSRAGSTPTPPTTSRTRSQPGWLPRNPNYKVKTFEGTSLKTSRSTSCRRRSNPTTPSTRSSRPTSARKRSRRRPTRWASRTHLLGNPAQALGGLEVGVTPLEMADVYATLADGG